MRRYLPPVILLLLLGLVATRVFLHPAREESQAQIRAMLSDPGEHDRAAAEIDAYLADYDEPDDRWFAAEAFLRAGRYRKALAAVFDAPEVADAPGAVRRFGAMGLDVVGWNDADRTIATPFEPQAMVALVEADETWAVERLMKQASTEPLDTTAEYLFQASRFADRGPALLLSAAFRRHVDNTGQPRDPYRIAAAFTALRPEPYPEREADIDSLLAVLKTLRRSNGDVWTAAAHALGRSESPRARSALEKHLAFLAKASAEREQRDAIILRAALLGAGDWAQLDPLREWLNNHVDDAFLGEWVAESTLNRLERGDAEAEATLKALWRGMGSRSPVLRFRIGVRLLLPASGREPVDPLPIPSMIEDLDTSRQHPLLPGVSTSYRLRIGAPGAVVGMVQLMDVYGVALEEGPHRTQEVFPAWIFTLRSMLLYG